jgi:lysine 2,3-aminomutase
MDLNLILENRKSLLQNPDFGSYTFQLSNRILGKDLYQYFELTDEELIGIEKTIRLNVSTTPYYLLLADPSDPNCLQRSQMIR